MMIDATPNVPAGWFIDPEDSTQLRWWDGSSWTSNYAPLVAADAPVQQTVTVPAIERPVEQPQAAYGQSSYGQSTFGQGTNGQSTYGQSEFGQPSYGQSTYGQSTFGQSAYGQSNNGYSRPITAAPPLTFGESIATVLRKYVDFTGVASRSEYWWWYLFTTLVTTLFYVVTYTSRFLTSDTMVALLAAIMMLVWSLATFLPSLAVTVRRLRDTGRSWLYLLLSLVPFGSIVLLVFFCQASTGYAGEPAQRAAQNREVRWPQQ